MKRFFLLPLALLSLAGYADCASARRNAGVVNPYPDDPRECVRNFTYDGSFRAGRTFRSRAFVRNVRQADAMKRATRHIAQNGFQITSADSNYGVISASQTVSYGRGKTAPLSVSFDQEKGGLQMELSFSISGGLTTPVEAVQKFFCEVVDVVGQKK